MNQAHRSHQVAIVTFLAALLLAAGAARAQDANYWDNQYGTKAELLGGLVVGSPSDLSATFYNPGWIPLGVDASLLVTTQAVQHSSLSITSPIAGSPDFTYTDSGTSPGFLAGRFNALKAEGWQFAWSYIEKVRYRFDAAAIQVDPQMIPTADGEEWFLGEGFRATKTNEYWYGFTSATKIGEHTAIGFTPYFAYRSQRQRIQIYTRSLGGTTVDESIYVANEFDFGHGRLLAKVGIAFDYDPVKFGLTVTTPSLGLFGSGNVLATASASGFDVDGNGTADPYVAANSQEDIASSWQSPVSVALGVSWRRRDTALYVTTEWFAEMDQEQILEAQPFRSQTTGRLITYDMSLDQKSVINVGLGIDHRFSERFSLYGAFRTDFSSLERNQASNILMGTWDLWHLSAGASFQFLGVGFTSGLQYSFSNDTIDRYLNVDGPEDLPGEEDISNTAEVRYRRLKLVIGFDLALLGAG